VNFWFVSHDYYYTMIHAFVLGMALQSASVSASAERRMLADLNATRARSGLSILKMDRKLSEVALAHGIDMVEHSYFDHASRDGQSPFDRMKHDRIAFSWAGENIAESPNEATAYAALLQSPEHLQNIMQPHFGKVGIAAVVAPDGQMFFVQDFTN